MLESLELIQSQINARILDAWNITVYAYECGLITQINGSPHKLCEGLWSFQKVRILQALWEGSLTIWCPGLGIQSYIEW